VPPSPPVPNIHYEAGYTDSWHHRRCRHEHRTLLEAAECAITTGCGWYVFAVENDRGRQLTDDEEEIVNRFRFKPRA
jgi:hemerythrin-like domain-containing protein